MTEQLDGDDWRELHRARPSKRAKNRIESARLLRAAGIEYTEHNGGAHLVVTHKGRTADFWPGTGKWAFRNSLDYRRGVRNLIVALERLSP